MHSFLVESGFKRNLSSDKKIVPIFTKQTLPMQKCKSGVQYIPKREKSSLLKTIASQSRFTGPPTMKVPRMEQIIKPARAISVQNSTDCRLKCTKSSSGLGRHHIEKKASSLESKEKADDSWDTRESATETIKHTSYNSCTKITQSFSPKPNENSRWSLPQSMDFETINISNSRPTQEVFDATNSSDGRTRHFDAYNLAKEIILQAELSQKDSSIKANDKDESESINVIKSGIGLAQNEVQYELIIHKRFRKEDFDFNFSVYQSKNSSLICKMYR